jgi:hypothetical protein
MEYLESLQFGFGLLFCQDMAKYIKKAESNEPGFFFATSGVIGLESSAFQNRKIQELQTQSSMILI